MKKWWQSKTMWTNLLMGIGGVVIANWPAAEAYFTVEYVAGFIGIVNIVLRAVSKDGISLEIL